MKKRGICLAGAALTVALLTIGITKAGNTHTLQASEQTATVSETAVQAATGDAIFMDEPERVIPVVWAKKKGSLKVGKSYVFQLKTQGKVINGRKVQWSVSNKKIATIDSKGKLLGRQVGTVTVKAKYLEKTLSCKVKITAKKVIGIDAGHQAAGNSGLEPIGPGASVRKPKVAGGTCGTVSRVPEYQFTLKVAKALKKELVKRGYAVVMTRTRNDVNITNKERAIKINESGADICIRLHGDGGASSARGACALYPSTRNAYVGKLSAKSYKLSKSIMQTYCKATGIGNRGCVQRDDLTGTNWSKVPVTLIELGFMTNASEDRYMQSATGQKAMVGGLADGIDLYFGN